jgi:Glycosyltransferase family 87
VNRVGADRSVERLLCFALAVMALLMSLIAFHNVIREYPWGVDVVIPLRAASRWLAGGQPYLASSFLNGPGYDLPYLYPPFVLPFVAPLTALPQTAVVAGWFMVNLGAAVFACRRLAIPWLVIPFLLVWPPFSEALLGGNVGIVLFAAFVALMWRSPRSAEDRPSYQALEVDPASLGRRAVHDGLLASAVGALKGSQVQPWFYLLRRNPRSALIGLLAVAGLAVITLPVLGLGAWSDWLAQLGRASDPSWILAGAGITRSLPGWVGDLLVLATIAAVFVVPDRHAGAWLGLLVVIGSPSLRVFGLLFALPAMLVVRREVGLIAGLLFATYTFEGWWLGIGLVAGSMVLGLRRPAFLEPTRPTIHPGPGPQVVGVGQPGPLV